MNGIKEFKLEKEFKIFEQKHLESGVLFKKIKSEIPFDIKIKDFQELEWIIISFGEYSENKITLKFSKKTNELFIADMNDGGHVPKCRIIKFCRKDIYEKSLKLIEWTENRSYKMWLT